MSSPARDSVGAAGRTERGAMWVFAFTIFLSAFLLFQVELILSAYILPWFGGSAAVWTTTMLVFQTLLFGGYSYAHYLASRVSARRQASLHLTFLVISLALLLWAAFRWPSPITPGANWKPSDINHPVLDIVVLMMLSVGIPFFLLSTSGPLLQAWFTRAARMVPYRLYAVSNLGSLLGLLSYPFLVQRILTLRAQGWTWAVSYLIFIVGIAACASRFRGAAKEDAAPLLQASESSRPASSQVALWVLLPMCASVALLATTGVISLYLAAMPLIWVLPLTAYLVSFIICFGRPRWYVPAAFHALYAIGCVALLVTIASSKVWLELASCLFLLFTICMICHGEVVRIQPPKEQATAFYLCISGGGALGGIFVGLLAPMVFSRIWEFQAVIIAVGLLVVLGLYRQRDSWLYTRPAVGLATAAILLIALPYLGTRFSLDVAREFDRMGYFQSGAFLCIPLVPLLTISLIKPKRIHFTWAMLAFAILALILIGVGLYRVPWGQNGITLARVRNFYGVLEVQESPKEVLLMHGKTLHGFQFREPKFRPVPTAYYAPQGGFGQFMLAHPKRNPVAPMRLGVIGMGTGTIAAYGLPGDYIRYYELNPAVERLVRGEHAWFTYVNESRAKVDVVLGDGRLSLERELQNGGGQNFDLLVLDAFNGDAIPTHLLTLEAFQTYMRHLAPDGVMVVHISSSLLDLSPVIAGAMQEIGLHGIMTYSADDRSGVSSIWVLLARNADMLRSPGVLRLASPLDPAKRAVLWTDDFTDITQLLYY